MLVACSCPEGSVKLDGRCIGQASFCQSNNECSSAKFVCAKPCVNEPVNVAFLDEAKVKASQCPKTIACRDMPEFIETWCEDNVCRARTRHSGDFVAPVNLIEVRPGARACMRRGLNGSQVRIQVFNNDSLPLENIQAVIIGTEPVSSERNATTQRELLLFPIKPMEFQNVSIPVMRELGGVASLTLFARRHIRFSGFDAGVVSSDVAPVTIVDIPACD